MRRHQCLLLGQRREGDGKIEKDRRCDPLAPAGATGLAAQCLDEAPRLQLGGSEGSPARLGQNTWLNGNAEHVPAMTAGFRIEGAGVQA